MIGGALAKPVDSMPSLFSPGSLFDKLPYLLPNLFSAMCVFIGLIIGILFLEETHAEKKVRRDRGVELGNYLISRIWLPTSRKGKQPEEQPLLGEMDEALPGYRSADAFEPHGVAPDTTSRDCLSLVETGQAKVPRVEKPRTGIFNRTTVLIIITFGILAL